jgi:ABC-type Fe3+ transport system permease subunit
MAVTNLVSGTPNDLAQTRGGFARVWRTLRQLFHEVVGGIFLVLSLAWLQSTIRAYTRDVAHWLVAAAFGIAIVMAVFAWTSFRRARQLR